MGWYANLNIAKKLLALAKDMADRLSPAFTKSPTGMPYRFVNLKTGAVRDPKSFPAEIGTYIAEWGTLSKATGDNRYFDMAKRATKALFDRRSKIDLVADTINIETGAWNSRRASIGPPTDSYFDGPGIWAQCIFDTIMSALDELASRTRKTIDE